MLSAIPSVGLSPLLLYSESVVLDSQLCDSTTPPEVPAGEVADAASQVILLTQREEPDRAQELQRNAAALALQLYALQLAHGLPQQGIDVQQLQSLID